MTIKFRNPRKLGDAAASWLRQDGRDSACIAATWRYFFWKALRSALVSLGVRDSDGFRWRGRRVRTPRADSVSRLVPVAEFMAAAFGSPIGARDSRGRGFGEPALFWMPTYLGWHDKRRRAGAEACATRQWPSHAPRLGLRHAPYWHGGRRLQTRNAVISMTITAAAGAKRAGLRGKAADVKAEDEATEGPRSVQD